MMDRPNLGQGYVPSHWIEYADHLEAERDKLTKAMKTIHLRSQKMSPLNSEWVEDVTEAALDMEIVYPDEDEIPVDRAGRKMYNKFGYKLDIGER
jgi:hypothetical protein